MHGKSRKDENSFRFFVVSYEKKRILISRRERKERREIRTRFFVQSTFCSRLQSPSLDTAGISLYHKESYGLFHKQSQKVSAYKVHDSYDLVFAHIGILRAYKIFMIWCRAYRYFMRVSGLLLSVDFGDGQLHVCGGHVREAGVLGPRLLSAFEL